MRVDDAGHPAFPIQIAGGQLGDRRHVCGVFEDPEAAYRTLLPFILDGFEGGQRAFHIVDPAERRAHIERLAHAGVDVEKALGAGQLQVETWDSVYLRGGRFDRAATVNLILNALTEGRELGFPITRLIGFMGWTYPDAATAWDLASYESQVEAALRGIPDPVVCAYDLEAFPPACSSRCWVSIPWASSMAAFDARPVSHSRPGTASWKLRRSSSPGVASTRPGWTC